MLNCKDVAVPTLVMTGGMTLMVRASAILPVPAALAAPKATEKLPIVVGVPEMTPEAALRLNPEGRPEALKLVGLLVAVMA